MQRSTRIPWLVSLIGLLIAASPGRAPAATPTTSLVSVGLNDSQANGESGPPSMSADGRYVAFVSEASNLVKGDTNNRPDIFVRDRRLGRTRRVSLSSRGRQVRTCQRFTNCFAPPDISSTGRFVTFGSTAANLVHGDTNREPDIFVHDRRTKRTTRVSVGSTGAQANDASTSSRISRDGRVVTFPFAGHQPR